MSTRKSAQAYIIRNGSPIATVDTTARDGALVKYAYDCSKESLDARRDVALVNAHVGRISRARKWSDAEKYGFVPCARAVAAGEYLVVIA